MMRARSAACVLCAVLLLVATNAGARRLPGPGGKLTVALPPALAQAVVDAHVNAPLLERVLRPEQSAQPNGTNGAQSDEDTGMGAEPTVRGAPGFRSSSLTAIEADAALRTWRLRASVALRVVADSVRDCLTTPKSGVAAWPSLALGAAHVDVDVAVATDVVTLHFSAPVGPVPELLAGCTLRAPGAVSSGAFASTGPGLLAWKSGGVEAPPLLGLIEIKGPSEVADVVAFGPEGAGTTTVTAPFPDTLLLLQSQQARTDDVLGLADATMGTLGFAQAMRVDLLAAAYASGRGVPSDGVLPPGLAPARPLPERKGGTAAGPLSLAALPRDAKHIVVRRVEGDTLIDGVVERLAVLLRNRGLAVDLQRPSDELLRSGVEVLRWRAPTTDGALALLSLAGERPELVTDDALRRAVADPRLLAASADARLAAAVDLERAWIERHVLVPLMLADRWFSVDPDLRGMTVRPDGVPIFNDAYFGGAR